VDVLSFDCYGTLIDWEHGLWEATAAWRTRTGLDWPRDRLLEAYGTAETAIEAAQPQLRYPDVLREALAVLGQQVAAPPTRDELERFGASVADWPAFDDSPAALAALGGRHRLVILSNIDRASFAASNARLGVTFDAIITAEDVGAYKPDRRGFDRLLQTVRDLGSTPDRLLHVAQSLYHDHVPAKALGLRTCWIDRRRGQPGWGATPPPPAEVSPDLVFGSLEELAATLAS
jgi:2-haloacid dehalogenase